MLQGSSLVHNCHFSVSQFNLPVPYNLVKNVYIVLKISASESSNNCEYISVESFLQLISFLMWILVNKLHNVTLKLVWLWKLSGDQTIKFLLARNLISILFMCPRCIVSTAKYMNIAVFSLTDCPIGRQSAH